MFCLCLCPTLPSSSCLIFFLSVFCLPSRLLLIPSHWFCCTDYSFLLLLSATPLYLLAFFASSCALCARPSRLDTARWPLPTVIQVLSTPCVQLFAFSKARSFTLLRLRCLTARLGARLYMYYQLPFRPSLPGLAMPSGRRQVFG